MDLSDLINSELVEMLCLIGSFKLKKTALINQLFPLNQRDLDFFFKL